MPLLTHANIVTAFIAINFFAFAAFGIDKMKAEAGSWRWMDACGLAVAAPVISPCNVGKALRESLSVLSHR